MRSAIFAGCAAFCIASVPGIRAQEPTIRVEPPTPLTQSAAAFDAEGRRVIEATLRTTTLNGAPDTPVTNTRIVLRNVSEEFYSFVSSHVTFYDSGNVRCGEGIMSAGALAPNESVETDTPGIRITCSPTGWRIVATTLVPRTPESISVSRLAGPPAANFVISIDGEEHPIQLGRPMVVTLADRPRTIVVRTAP